MPAKYDMQEYIYSGYAMPLQQFSDLLRQIPGYSEIMDRSTFTIYDTHICYSDWKRQCLPREMRKKAPHIMMYSNGEDTIAEGNNAGGRQVQGHDDNDDADDDEDDGLPCKLTHVLILIRAIPFKEDAQVDDPNHDDAPKIRLEKQTDRLSRKRFVKFFQSQGARDMKAEDYAYTWYVGPHPKLLMD